MIVLRIADIERFIIVMLLLGFQVACAQHEVEKLLDKGYVQFEKGQYEKAMAFFNKAESLDKSNAETYFLRGVTLHAIGEVKKAVSDLERAIKLQPGYVDAYQFLGFIYLVSEAPKQAIYYFDIAIGLEPESPEIFANRGTAKCMLDDVEGAAADWKEAVRLGVPFTEQMRCN